MQYNEKYPNAQFGPKEWADEKRGIFLGSRPAPCAWCKVPTHFVNVLLHVHVCSDECDVSYVKQINQELTRLMEKERYENSLHEFEPDDLWCITASCRWCGKEIPGNNTPKNDPAYTELCSARIRLGTDAEDTQSRP